VPPAPPTGLRGEYFGNVNLTGTPLLTRYEAVDFAWGTAAPAAGLPADNFSVRWTGFIRPTTTGSHRFRTSSDDGVRVWVNGVRLINNWTDHGTTTNTSSAITLTAGQRYAVTVEYYDRTGGSTMRWQWLRPGTTGYVAVPLSVLAPQ
jgi:PA14 domain